MTGRPKTSRRPSGGRPEAIGASLSFTGMELEVLIATISARDWEILADRRHLKGSRRTTFRRACVKLVLAEMRAEASAEDRRERIDDKRRKGDQRCTTRH